MTALRAVSLSALILGAGAANAAVSGVVWRTVDNSTAAGDAQWGAFLPASTKYTFDLILQGDAGQRINGINMGDAAAPQVPFGIQHNGSIFNHLFGTNLRSAAFEAVPGFQGIAFDTFVAMGSTTPGPTISFAGTADLSNSPLRATWFTTDNAVLDANGEMRIMRVTIAFADAGFDPYTDGGILGTPGIIGAEGGTMESRIEVGLPGGELQVLTVGNAFEIPAPGAAFVAGLAGLVGLRRRR